MLDERQLSLFVRFTFFGELLPQVFKLLVLDSDNSFSALDILSLVHDFDEVKLLFPRERLEHLPCLLHLLLDLDALVVCSVQLLSEHSHNLLQLCDLLRTQNIVAQGVVLLVDVVEQLGQLLLFNLHEAKY